MHWQLLVALVVIVPIILIPVLFIWYLNIGGIYSAIKAAWTKRAISKEREEDKAKVKQPVAIDK